MITRLAPHDQLWFIKAATHLTQFHWLGPYDSMTLIRPPGYALWIAFSHFLGIPLRLSSELLLILSAFVFVQSLLKTRLPAWFCSLLFGVILFYPLNFDLYDEVLSETFYFPLLLLAMGGMISQWGDRDSRTRLFWAFLTSVALAFLWITREETLLIVAYLVFFSILDGVQWLKGGKNPHSFLKRIFISFFLPLSLIGGAHFLIGSLNQSHYGLSVLSEMGAPGFSGAVKALLRIKEVPSRRYVSIPKEAREKAYQSSAAFEELRPELEGRMGQDWIQHGCVMNGVCDDLSSAWFLWAFRQGADNLGHYLSATEADRFYRRIAEEINRACADGKLECRHDSSRFLGFLNPDASTYSRFLFPSFLSVLRNFSSEEHPIQNNPFSGTPKVRALYQEMAGQPMEVPHSSYVFEDQLKNVIVEGWAFDPEKPLEKVQLKNSGEVIAETDAFQERPDVEENLQASGVQKVPAKMGFRLSSNRSLPDLHESEVSFLTHTEENIIPQYYSVDSVLADLFRTPKAWLRGLRSLYAKSAFPLAVGGLVGLAFLIFTAPFSGKNRELTLALLFIACVVFSRIALVTFMQSSMLAHPPIRHLYPIMPLAFCLPLIVIYQSVRVGRENFQPNATKS
ncbi:MAG: hypothetical protein U1F57_06005 [bacterium]